ncbi:MAG: PDZ domain-containing protein, partial [Acidimicrobiia bacterium]|nr:PDZ domain-containing protein [Acidimicrobiia bacterium]
MVLSIAGFIIWAVQPTDIYALRPGSVRDTTDIIQVSDADFFDPDGQINFTTITLSANISRWEKWRLDDDPTIQLVPEDVINGDRDRDEQRELNLAAMESSKDLAAIVALEYLGLAGDPTGEGALIRSVLPGAAADGILVSTDVVIGVDGSPIEFADELVDAVRALEPGDEITLEVLRIDETISVPVVLGTGDDGESAQLGVEVTTFQLSADFPVDVDIDTGEVGGPSAGLAFTLGIIDVLTPGELTGGLSVATTGTIQADGGIGPVGGVAQKAVAARDSGIDVFIVPSIEFDEALSQAGDMRVETADTLEEAIAVLD